MIFGEYLWQRIVHFSEDTGFDEEEEEEEEEVSILFFTVLPKKLTFVQDGTRSKVLTVINSHKFKTRLLEVIRKSESFYSFFNLLNFISFLYSGKYPTLIFRLCRLRLISSSRSMSREVSFEFLNRQLVWDEFTNFLIFILPLLHLPKLKRRMTNLISSTTSNATDAEPSEKLTGQLSFLPERTCAICYHQDTDAAAANRVSTIGTTATAGMRANEITNPYAAVECGHIYCYVCLVTQIEEQEGEGWECLRCRTLVTKARPWVNIITSTNDDKSDEDEDDEEDSIEHLSRDNSSDEETSGDLKFIEHSDT